MITFDDFRWIFLHQNSSLIDFSINCKSTPRLNIESTEYHLIRQVIMLLHRKITDLSSIIKTLKPYSSFEIFNHLTRFKNPNPNLNHLATKEEYFKNLPSKMMMQRSLHISTSPNLKTNKSFILDSQGKIIQDESPSLFSKKINVFNKFESAIKNKSVHSVSNTIVDFTKKNSLDFGLNNMSVDMNSCLEIETILNFLEFNKVPFLSQDVSLIFEELGSLNGSLKLEQLERYLGLDVWG